MPETHPDLPRSVGKGQSALYADLRSQHLRRNGDSPDHLPMRLHSDYIGLEFEMSVVVNLQGPRRRERERRKRGLHPPLLGKVSFFAPFSRLLMISSYFKDLKFKTFRGSMLPDSPPCPHPPFLAFECLEFRVEPPSQPPLSRPI